jgi:intracellular multiplication protein IcmK
MIKTRLSTILMILLASSAVKLYAADEGADTSSVDQFKAWLQERDNQNQQNVNSMAQEGKAGTSSDPSTQADATQSDISQEAFKQVVQQTMPMTPEQIREYKRLVNESQLASATPVGIPPKPVSTTIQVNLAPGSVPPSVSLYQGFISSLIFLDSSGAPWPIASFDLGNPQAFSIFWDKKSNILMVQPLQPHTYANLAINLKDSTIPVMLTLVPGQAVVHYRVDLRVSGLGPNASIQVDDISALPAGADPSLLGVLDGIPPPNSKEVSVKGVEAKAWTKGSNLFLRTKSTVLSPGWISKMSSPDGTNAYEMPLTPSVLISYLGEPREIQIEGE